MEGYIGLGRSSEVRNEPLNSQHHVSAFDCGRESLNIFLQRYALDAPRQGLSRTWVLSGNDGNVLAYFTLAASSVVKSEASPRVAKGMPDYGIPCLLLARLAVDRSVQGQGLGGVALEIVLRKALVLGRNPSMNDGTPGVPVRALLVHAIDDQAAHFYRHYGFESSPTDPNHLFLLLKDVEKSFRGV